MFGGAIVSFGNELVYYNEVNKFKGIIENPINFPLDNINDNDHKTNTKYNGVKLQHYMVNNNVSDKYNSFDMMNIILIDTNDEWQLCYSKRIHLTVGIIIMKHKSIDNQITNFLNSMHSQIEECFIKSREIPLYILTMKCHLIFNKLLYEMQHRSCYKLGNCFNHKNISNDDYKEYQEEIEMNKLLDNEALSISSKPPSYSKIDIQSDTKQHSIKLSKTSSTAPPSYDMDRTDDNNNDDIDSDHKSVTDKYKSHSTTDVMEEEEEEKDYKFEYYSSSSTDSDSEYIVPQNRYSSSDVIVAAEEIKFSRIKSEKVSKKKARQRELKKAYHTMAHIYDIDELEMNYDTSFKYGLSSKMVKDLLIKYGPNQETPPKSDPMWLLYIKEVCYGWCSMFRWFAATFCFIAYAVTNNIYYFHIGIVFSVYIIFKLCYPFCCGQHGIEWEEPIHFILVTRDGILQEIDSRELVPGDIIELKKGMQIPADIRIFECSVDLEVDCSSLTGESEPQRRDWRAQKDEVPAEAACLCFFGTYITNGKGRGVVIITGDDTFMGRTATLSCSTDVDRGGIAINPIFKAPTFERVKNMNNNESSLIDNVFGDLENLFYLLSDLTYYFMFNEINYCGDIIFNFIKGILCLCIIYPFIIIISLSMVLTSCFFLLIFRFNKIEMDTINITIRQKIIEYESCFQRFIRLIIQFIRCSFMSFILFIYPLIVIYVIIPNYNDNDKNKVAMISIGLYLSIILLLQIFGTFRGLKSFINKHEKEIEEKKRSEFEPKKFIWNIGSLFTIFMILVESMTLISYYSININISNTEQVTASFKIENKRLIKINDGLKNILSSSFIFFRFTPNLDYSMYFCIFSVGLLLIMFLFRFIYELRHYAYLKHILSDPIKARDFYFYSFIGTIIYGHRNLKGVNKWIVKIISILCDFLFLIICDKLIFILLCIESIDYSNKQCWNGKHQHFAAISLILLSFYIPMSTMIAPMFDEEDINKKTNKSFWSFSNSVEFVKPYITIITVTKCFMLFTASFIFNGYQIVNIICNILTSLILIIFTLNWAITNLKNYGLTQNHPIFPFAVCLLRIFGFYCVIIGCFVQILKYANIIDNSCDFILFTILICISGVIFTIITRNTHSKFNQFDNINQYNSKVIRYYQKQ